MRKGTINQSGSPRDINFAPANSFVAEFIGATNIVEAKVADGVLTLPGGYLRVADHTMAGPVVAMIRPVSFLRVGLTRGTYR
jgi:putative spermidine/putrescine transport system ATP-binding protein